MGVMCLSFQHILLAFLAVLTYITVSIWIGTHTVCFLSHAAWFLSITCAVIKSGYVTQRQSVMALVTSILNTSVWLEKQVTFLFCTIFWSNPYTSFSFLFTGFCHLVWLLASTSMCPAEFCYFIFVQPCQDFIPLSSVNTTEVIILTWIVVVQFQSCLLTNWNAVMSNRSWVQIVI